MVTITIKHGNLNQKDFSTTSELLNYLIDLNEDYGVLHELKKTDLSSEQTKRFKKALQLDKSKLLNI